MGKTIILILSTALCWINGHPAIEGCYPQTDSGRYGQDSAYLAAVIKSVIIHNKRPYQNKQEFDETTEYYIDSFIYSPDKLRLIAFVITKNSNRKNIYDRQDIKGYHFGANYFFCSRDSIGTAIKVYDYTPYSLVRYPSYETVKALLQEYCFQRLALKSTEQYPMYNVNDSRFWHSMLFDLLVKSSALLFHPSQ